jgi:hypothetical protein
VFNRAVTVTNFSGSSTTSGTLRYALTNAQDGDVITFSVVTPGTTEIPLTGALPEITKSITLKGNGITLTRAATWTDNTSQLLRITNTTAEVKISRVHFKDGLAAGNGAAIRNSGILTLESCIFSGNSTISIAAYGGAVYSTNTLTVRGCTFYDNTSPYSGGAVYFSTSGKTLTLEGNLFYGNIAPYYPVVHVSSGTVNASYNVVDVALGTLSTQAGWTAGTGDTTFTALSIVSDPFDTTTFVPVAGLQSPGVLPSPKPTGFPDTDFYGTTRTFPGAPGAVAEASGP